MNTISIIFALIAMIDIVMYNTLISKKNQEKQISATHRAYNQAVTDLNNAIRMFPTNLMASYMKLQPKKVFEITLNERANVDVGGLFNKCSQPRN